jgi:hypothetical protein
MVLPVHGGGVGCKQMDLVEGTPRKICEATNVRSPSISHGAMGPTTPRSARRSESRSSCRGYLSRSSFGPNWAGLTKMLATTTSLFSRASRTKVRCPASEDEE